MKLCSEHFISHSFKVLQNMTTEAVDFIDIPTHSTTHQDNLFASLGVRTVTEEYYF